MISAGELDQRITLQSRIAGKDARGQVSETWGNDVTVWARARPIRGREYFAASATQSEATIVFGIRHRTGIDSAMRVLWKGEPYQLVAPAMNVDGRNEFVELMCAGGRP